MASSIHPGAGVRERCCWVPGAEQINNDVVSWKVLPFSSPQRMIKSVTRRQVPIAGEKQSSVRALSYGSGAQGAVFVQGEEDPPSTPEVYRQ
jgi:hypothetical protein